MVLEVQSPKGTQLINGRAEQATFFTTLLYSLGQEPYTSWNHRSLEVKGRLEIILTI